MSLGSPTLNTVSTNDCHMPCNRLQTASFTVPNPSSGFKKDGVMGLRLFVVARPPGILLLHNCSPPVITFVTASPQLLFRALRRAPSISSFSTLLLHQDSRVLRSPSSKASGFPSQREPVLPGGLLVTFFYFQLLFATSSAPSTFTPSSAQASNT